jgi:pimeloyl-ACP methyl ester carboxylesterase
VRDAAVTPEGARIRWVELPGREPPRVYVHGLGATSPAYFTEIAVHPLLAGHRSLLIDLLGHGISDRPASFDYTLEAHADALAEALTAAGVTGAELIAHSMGGSVAVVLAARHPRLVSRLVLVDANLDPIPRAPGSSGSSGIAAYTEQRFLAGGWEEVRDRVGPHWWSTMRLAGREALHRSAVHLVRGTVPTMRELLLGLKIPRTFLLPEADGPLPGTDALTASGVSVVAIPDCGHNIMLDTRRPSPASPRRRSRLRSTTRTGQSAGRGVHRPRSAGEVEDEQRDAEGVGAGPGVVRVPGEGEAEAVHRLRHGRQPQALHILQGRRAHGRVDQRDDTASGETDPGRRPLVRPPDAPVAEPAQIQRGGGDGVERGTDRDGAEGRPGGPGTVGGTGPGSGVGRDRGPLGAGRGRGPLGVR